MEDELNVSPEDNIKSNPAKEVYSQSSFQCPRHVLISVESDEEIITYQKIMQRIVQRYIFDIQREAEVTEGEI